MDLLIRRHCNATNRLSAPHYHASMQFRVVNTRRSFSAVSENPWRNKQCPHSLNRIVTERDLLACVYRESLSIGFLALSDFPDSTGSPPPTERTKARRRKTASSLRCRDNLMGFSCLLKQVRGLDPGSNSGISSFSYSSQNDCASTPRFGLISHFTFHIWPIVIKSTLAIQN
jgi:hypothetical protein